MRQATHRALTGLAASLLLLLAGSAARAENPQRAHQEVTAPVARGGFVQATPYDSLQAFLQEIARTHVQGISLSVEELARTREGRSVMLVRVRREGAHPVARALLFAQQHGDEPAGKEALTLLLARIAAGTVERMVLDSLELLIVPQMNPDGAERNQRRTSDSLDLNRQHAVLGSPEVLALHRLFLREMPEVTLDMHEYGSWSRSWAKFGIRRRADVQLGMITNPNCSARVMRYQHDSVYTFIARQMRRAGFAFQEYMVGSPEDRLRYSTTEFNDGRQSFGMLGTLSFIQEGRRWREDTDSLQRRAASQLCSVEGLLLYAAGHAHEIHDLVAAERAALPDLAGGKKDSDIRGSRPAAFVLRLEHFPAENPPEIPVTDLATGRDTVWRVTPYHGQVKALATTTLPSAYVVPAEQQGVLELLALHGVKSERVAAEKRVKVERSYVDSVTVDTVEEDPVPHPWLRSEKADVTLHPGDVIVPMDQLHVLFLATLLEPGSVWGLAKYPNYGVIRTGRQYPIMRIP